MPKRDQLRRLMEINQRIRAGDFPHPDQLATDLEVSRRVIFNDRAYLVNVLGAPLEFHRERRGWYYTEESYTLPSAIITRGELLALLLAVEAAQRQLEPILENELMLAVEKIGQSLSENIRVDLEALRRNLTFAPLPRAAVVPATFLLLEEAVASQKVVNMTYFSAYRGQSSRREVEPHHIVNAGGDWYLLAYDRAKTKMLTFNIARVEDAKLLPRGFALQSDFCPDDFVQSGFRAESGPQIYHVAVRFDAAQAPYIRERHFHATQQLEELEDGGVVLRFRASGLGELTRWVLQYGASAHVLSPPELVAQVASQARQLALRYAESP